MRILFICDGTQATEHGAQFLQQFHFPNQSRIVLLAAGKVTRKKTELIRHLERIRIILHTYFSSVDPLVLPGHFLDQVMMETMNNEYDLVVMVEKDWTRRLSRSTQMRNVTTSLAHHLNKPILIIRGLPDRLERVLICTSAQPMAGLTLNISGELLAGLPPDTEVRLLHVSMGKGGNKATPPATSTSRADQVWNQSGPESQYLSGEQALLKKSGLRASIRPRMRTGRVIDEVLAEVKEQDSQLIVIGSHQRAGRSWLLNLILQDVAKGLVQESPCSILVVG